MCVVRVVKRDCCVIHRVSKEWHSRSEMMGLSRYLRLYRIVCIGDLGVGGRGGSVA
jgi:cytidylate kinase